MGRSDPMEEKVCERKECGKFFRPRRETSRFCSVYCRNVVVARETVKERSDRARGRMKPGSLTRYRKIDGLAAHRVLAEQIAGRSLRPGEAVHHMDGDKFNDDPYNLIIMSSKRAHEQLGHRKPDWKKGSR